MSWTTDWTVDVVESNYRAIGIIDPEDIEQLIQDSKRLQDIEEDYNKLRLADMDAAYGRYQDNRVLTLVNALHRDCYQIGLFQHHHPDWQGYSIKIEYWEPCGDFIYGEAFSSYGESGTDSFSFCSDAMSMKEEDAIAFVRQPVQTRLEKMYLETEEKKRVREQKRIQELKAELSGLGVSV